MKTTIKLFLLSLCCTISSVAGQTPDNEPSRWEIGAHFTSFTLREPSNQPNLPPNTTTYFPLASPPITHPAIGGRISYNLNKSLALEAEANFSPTALVVSSFYGGGKYQQGFVGIKAGRRFSRVGLFAKARPGVMRFGKVHAVQRTVNFVFDGEAATAAITDLRPRAYFAADVGGVVELYHSRRFFTRFDAGDTIIRYNSRQLPASRFVSRSNGFFTVPTVFVSRTQFKHNFQFSAGVGFRF